MINVHEEGNVAKITQSIRPRWTCVTPAYNIVLTQHAGPSHRPTFSLHHSSSLPPTHLVHYSAPLELLTSPPTPYSSISLSWLDALAMGSFSHLNFTPYYHHPILGYQSCPWPPDPHTTPFLYPLEGTKQNPDLRTTHLHIILHIRCKCSHLYYWK